jgi:hypothetical protein
VEGVLLQVLEAQEELLQLVQTGQVLVEVQEECYLQQAQWEGALP